MTDAELRRWLFDALWFPDACWYVPVIDRAAGLALYLARPEHLAIDEVEPTPEVTAAWQRIVDGDRAALVIEPLAAVDRVLALLAFVEGLPGDEPRRQIAALRRNAWRLGDWRPCAPRWLLDVDDETAARLDELLEAAARDRIEALIAEHDLDPAALRVL